MSPTQDLVTAGVAGHAESGIASNAWPQVGPWALARNCPQCLHIYVLCCNGHVFADSLQYPLLYGLSVVPKMFKSEGKT